MTHTFYRIKARIANAADNAISKVTKLEVDIIDILTDDEDLCSNWAGRRVPLCLLDCPVGWEIADRTNTTVVIVRV